MYNNLSPLLCIPLFGYACDSRLYSLAQLVLQTKNPQKNCFGLKLQTKEVEVKKKNGNGSICCKPQPTITNYVPSRRSAGAGRGMDTNSGC
jgi:hypothetical protein